LHWQYDVNCPSTTFRCTSHQTRSLVSCAWTIRPLTVFSETNKPSLQSIGLRPVDTGLSTENTLIVQLLKIHVPRRNFQRQGVSTAKRLAAVGVVAVEPEARMDVDINVAAQFADSSDNTQAVVFWGGRGSCGLRHRDVVSKETRCVMVRAIVAAPALNLPGCIGKDRLWECACRL
jgi:hypothetical protein